MPLLKPKRCTWTLHEVSIFEEYYSTSCGERFTEVHLKRSNSARWKHCPNCGGRLTVVERRSAKYD